MKPLHIIIISLFSFFAIAGFFCFAGVICKSGSERTAYSGSVSIWGSLPKGYLEYALDSLNKKNKNTYSISYREIRVEDFDRTLIEALASGNGPDLIFLPHDLLIRYEDKISPIPYESYPLRVFKDTFIEEGELYLIPEGILGFPVALDPMVMYWNRDIFSDAGVARPPTSWDEFLTLAPRLTKTDAAFNVQQSAIAFGEYRNVDHAKSIVSMLIIQAGNPLVERSGQEIKGILEEQRGFVTRPADSAIRFYTEFSNPVKPVYSWNRALPRSQDFFTSGDLAVYFGHASEHVRIREKSPHLNFDVAMVPQTSEALSKATFGKMTSIALLKRSTNRNTAFLAIKDLSGKEFQTLLAQGSTLPSARRDLLSEPQTDALKSVFYASALISEGWLDPNPEDTNRIFQFMIEDVVSGRLTISRAVAKAHAEIEKLISAIYD